MYSLTETTAMFNVFHLCSYNVCSRQLNRIFYGLMVSVFMWQLKAKVRERLRSWLNAEKVNSDLKYETSSLFQYLTKTFP